VSGADNKFSNGAPNSGEGLGLAGGMTKAFIHSPLTLLFLIACLILGVLGFIFTPRQEDPQIDVPMVDVFFQFPGASAEQVASLATDPLERMMSEIQGVKHVYSASQRGAGMVTVEFDVGQKMEPSLVRLYDKLSSNQDKIPPGVSQPLVKPKAVDDVPVVTLTLWSESVDDAGLRLVALEMMQQLKEVRSTSQSFIVGGRQEQIRVEVAPERLRGFGIGIDQLAGVIRAANDKRDIGNVETSGRSMEVYTGSFLRHAQDIERLVVGVRNNAPVYVRDVARVIEGPGEASSLVQYFTGPAAEEAAHGQKIIKAEGAAAVTVSIAKKSGTNGVTVANEILEKVESLKGRIIPANVNVAVTRDYGKTANDKVNELFFKLTVATVAVSGLIYLFLGLRPMLVVGVIIPVVILLTTFSALLMGYTIDRVSLFALIFSIGILVDDATVVIENIYRRWLMQGRIDTPTTIDAVREVGNPTILATFTVIAALLPMGFVSGMMGPYMRPIPVLGSVAMLLSLFAAFMFTPWLAMRIRPSMKELSKMEEREHRLVKRLDRFYRGLLGPMIDQPWRARLFRLSIWVAFIVCCALFYTENVSVKMLPMDNKPEFNVVVNMPEGTALPLTANALQQIVAKVKEIPEVAAVQTYAGTASPYNFNGLVRHYYLRSNPWQGDVQVQLLDKSERKRSSHAIAVAAREALTPLARSLGARIAVVEMPPGPPVLQTVVAEIYGPDADTRRKVARDVTQIFEKAGSVGDADNYLQRPRDTLVFAVDQQKAEHYNVTMGDISRQLGFVMGGARLGDAKLGYELEPRSIVIQAALDVRSNVARLGETPIKTGANTFVPLSELGTFVHQPQDDIVYHKDLRAIEYVTGEAVGRLAAPIYAMIEVDRLLASYKTPDGATIAGTLVGPPSDGIRSGFEWTGEWTVTYETFRDMGLAFAAAIVLIYMLVVLEFGNFALPGIIMAPIPLTLIGIIPGHWLLGAEFTATSMIGWIALAGIIVRNSILLVDFSKHAILAGTPVREAVIESCRARTRPIIITSLALMGGSASIITDPIFQGMAISLLFGAAVSTALTLVVIPLACARAQGAYSTRAADFDKALAAANQEPAAAPPQDREARDAESKSAFAAPFNSAARSTRSLFGNTPLKPFTLLMRLMLFTLVFAIRGWRALFSGNPGRVQAESAEPPCTNGAPVRNRSNQAPATASASRKNAPMGTAGPSEPVIGTLIETETPSPVKAAPAVNPAARASQATSIPVAPRKSAPSGTAAPSEPVIVTLDEAKSATTPDPKTEAEPVLVASAPAEENADEITHKAPQSGDSRDSH
jgi:multidrug efflux pump subunit AcrB